MWDLESREYFFQSHELSHRVHSPMGIRWLRHKSIRYKRRAKCKSRVFRSRKILKSKVQEEGLASGKSRKPSSSLIGGKVEFTGTHTGK